MARRNFVNNRETCDCSVYQSYDKPVQDNLAMTPARVRELTAKGIAVSLAAPTDANFDGSPERGNFDLDPIYKRHMDQNTLWENSETSRRKLMSARDKLTVEQRAKKMKSKTS